MTPNRPTHTGAGRGATYSIQLTINTTHVTINTCKYITSHRELSLCYFACHTLPRALLALESGMLFFRETAWFRLSKRFQSKCYYDRKGGTTRRRSAEARPRPGRQGPYPERKATRYSIELQRYEVHTPPDHQRPRPTTNHKSELSLVMMLLGIYMRSNR